jgi:hypothetical protein
MDVVDHQLDISGTPDVPRDNPGDHTHAAEDHEPDDALPVRRPQDVLHEVQDQQEPGAHDPRRQADHHDEPRTRGSKPNSTPLNQREGRHQRIDLS